MRLEDIMKNFDRRTFIKKAGVGTALAGTTLAGTTLAGVTLARPALSKNLKELKMVSTWPRNFPGLGTGAQRLAERINKMLEGRVKITYYASGELVPAFESFDAVSSGAADMYHAAEYYWQGKHKAFNFFTAVPLGFIAPELDGWVNHGGGQELWDELSADFNIKPFMAGNTGLQMGGWFTKEINSIDDMKGLKMRMPGLGGEVLRRLGAAAVALPGGEIFPAFQSGAIDATEWVGPWNDLAFGFYKVAKNYYRPGFHEPGSGLSMGMNKGVWDSLDSVEQEVIKAACLAENNDMYSEYMANNGAALKILVEKHGVKLKTFPPEVFDQFAKYSEEVVAEVAEDKIGKKIYDSYAKARNDMGKWTDLAEYSYLSERKRVLFDKG